TLQMTQVDLARRAGVNKANLVDIEKGKTDPRLSTLRKIFNALYCDVLVEPRPRQPLNEILREKARSVAIKRLKQSMGTMALENQAPDAEVFRALLERRTDEILNDRREHLWRNGDERRERNSRRNSR
ncbi:MAG: helix-turn-helix domain-containing protein, partial [Gammaproteobacteria bacterium]